MAHILSRLCIILLLLSSYNSNAQEQNKPDSTKKELSLKEVTVVAQQSAIETAPGKTIVNVQAMAGNAGKNVLELLRKLPGVTVDGQGNISMTGKQGVLVTLDGRETYLSGDDLRDYLQEMTAEEVAQIELITQPSAHYDAEGNSGVINIKTRKIRKQGFNSNITTTYTKSKYSSGTSTAILNYHKNKFNLFSNINYINAQNGIDWKNDFQFRDAVGNTIATSSIHSLPVELFEKWNLRIGADYNYSENTSMGVSLTGAYYGNTMHSIISTINNDLSNNITSIIRNTDESSLRRNGGCNVYLKHSFSKRSELNVNIDYLFYTRVMSQFLSTEATQNGISIPDQLVLRSQLPRNTQVWSAKTDHSLQLANDMKIESGAKISYVSADMSGHFDTYNNGQWTYDASRSDHFLYNESISALYVNTVKKLTDKWETQIGLRGEFSQIHGLQMATNEAFSKQLPALFPTAYISYKPDSNNSLELNYGRRVERPSYNLLNPFSYYTFYNTYQKGNPNLLPQYSHNIELKHSYKNKLISSLEYSAVSNNISTIVVADNTTQTTYGIPINFGTTEKLNLGITYNDKPYPWWDLMVSVRAGYSNYSGVFNNDKIHKEGTDASIWVNNQFTIEQWVAESWINYNSGTVTSPTSNDTNNVYMSFGVSRKLLHDTLTVKVSIDDPFYIYKNVSETSQAGLYSTSTLLPNSRLGTLSLTYNIGKNAERNAANKIKAPDEANRM